MHIIRSKNQLLAWFKLNDDEFLLEFFLFFEKMMILSASRNLVLANGIKKLHAYEFNLRNHWVNTIGLFFMSNYMGHTRLIYIIIEFILRI